MGGWVGGCVCVRSVYVCCVYVVSVCAIAVCVCVCVRECECVCSRACAGNAASEPNNVLPHTLAAYGLMHQ